MLIHADIPYILTPALLFTHNSEADEADVMAAIDYVLFFISEWKAIHKR